MKAVYLLCGALVLIQNAEPVGSGELFQGWQFVAWKAVCLGWAWAMFAAATKEAK